MVSTEYLTGRIKWTRPQAMVWSDVAFVLQDGAYFPPDGSDEGVDYLIITDHNRAAISLTPNRIESRSRMINGTSRSYFTADKYKLSTSWTMLPSRIASKSIEFDVFGKHVTNIDPYVVDAASAALDLIEWYETHPGDFYVYLSYDLGPEYDIQSTIKNVSMARYAVQKKMFFDSFGSSLEKRGLYDMYNIDVILDEV